MSKPYCVECRLCLVVLMALSLFGSGCSSINVAPDSSPLKTGEGVQQASHEQPINQRLSDIANAPSDLRPAVAETMPGKELNMVSYPIYRVAPPDVLIIEAIAMVPKAPYKIQPLDQLQVMADLAPQPIAQILAVEPAGNVNLGLGFGSVKVEGLSVPEATAKIKKFLSAGQEDVNVTVALVQIAGQQAITGEHLVRPDGHVSMGIYGSVYISGMTLPEARKAIEEHLSEWIQKPKISIDVFAYNSLFYRVITEGAGQGDRVVTLPCTGNETVLDAIGRINGLTALSSKKIWIARPTPGNMRCYQILPVDWNEITKWGGTATNYQIMPNDRVYVAQDRMIALDSWVGKMIRPFERVMGFLLLNAQTIQAVQRFPEGFRTGF